jgi:hypothetical protein
MDTLHPIRHPGIHASWLGTPSDASRDLYFYTESGTNSLAGGHSGCYDHLFQRHQVSPEWAMLLDVAGELSRHEKPKKHLLACAKVGQMLVLGAALSVHMHW